MSRLSTLAIAALASAGLAAPASASLFTPKNTNFSALGPVTITTQQVVLDCTPTTEAVVTGGGEVEFMGEGSVGYGDAGEIWEVGGFISRTSAFRSAKTTR